MTRAISRVLVTAIFAGWLAIGCNEGMAVRQDRQASDRKESAGSANIEEPLSGGAGSTADPLVGTWTFRGQVPAYVTAKLTLGPEKVFTFTENVAPATTPIGYEPDGCIVTHSILGTYVQHVIDGVSALSWTFSSGVANVITGCRDPRHNDEGTRITAEDVDGYIGQGLVPPKTVTYSVTSTTLILNPAIVGTNLSSRTVFNKVSD